MGSFISLVNGISYGDLMIKIFSWHTVREVLPNRDSLRSQGINLPFTCVFCNGNVHGELMPFIFELLSCIALLEWKCYGPQHE